MAISVAKASDKTSIEHNNRSMSESELKKLTHIDQNRLDQNEYLVNIPIEQVYEIEFAEALGNYNAKQKRTDRKIDSYYDHIVQSKKHMLQQEIIFQVGEQEDFDNQENRVMAKDILREHFERFKKENPQLNIYNAVIHDDEATPHLHVNFVPVATDYKRGLEKQVSFDKALLQQNPNLNKIQPFTEWRANQVMELERALNKNKIERKIVGTKDYKNQKEFKLRQDLDKQIVNLEIHKTELENNVNKELAKLDNFKARVAKLDKLVSLDSSKAQKHADKLLTNVKPALFSKEMVQIPKSDLESLENAFRSASQGNERVNRKNIKLEKELDELKDEVRELRYENRLLKIMEPTFKFLESLHEAYKPFIKKRHDQLQTLIGKIYLDDDHKDLLRGFVSSFLKDRDLTGAIDVARDSYNETHKATLENRNIGATQKEQDDMDSIKNTPRQRMRM